MKIMSWKLFLEADETQDAGEIEELNNLGDQVVKDNDKVNKESLDEISKELAFFKTKKIVMEEIFKDIKKLDSDIDNELQSRVYNNQRDVKKRNKYLKELEAVYRLRRKADKIKLQMEVDGGRKDEVQKQINDLSDRFNQIDDVDQKSQISERIEKSRTYLNTLSQTINTNKSEYAKIDKNYDTKRKSFEAMMKLEEQKIKNLSQK